MYFKNHKLVTLTLEDDSILQLVPLQKFKINNYEYIALTPPGEESENVYFYQLIQHKNNEIELLNIDSPDVLDKVLDEFDIWLENQLKQQEE